MDTEELKTRKSVSISRIKPGMYVVSLDRSWFQTPFYLHRRLIKNAEEIEQLKKLGVRGAHFKAFAVDLRNHGRSPHSDIFDNDVMSADLREFMKRQALRRVMLLGHSMSGRVAMQFAIDYPEQVDRLVIVDITPKPYEPSQRYLLKALCSLDLTRYKSFADVDAAQAPEFSSESLRHFLLKNLARDENGGLRWKAHLAAIDRNCDKLGRGLAPERSLAKPALFIRGGRSNYIEDADAPLIRQIFLQADIATLPEAGHWVHVEQPQEFFQTVVNFLSRA